MNAIIQKWGNSLALRIPQSLAKDVHLKQGAAVDLEVVEGKIVLTARAPRRYRLSQLIKNVTRKNRHQDIDWGHAVGKEVW